MMRMQFEMGKEKHRDLLRQAEKRRLVGIAMEARRRARRRAKMAPQPAPAALMPVAPTVPVLVAPTVPVQSDTWRIPVDASELEVEEASL